MMRVKIGTVIRCDTLDTHRNAYLMCLPVLPKSNYEVMYLSVVVWDATDCSNHSHFAVTCIFKFWRTSMNK